MATGAGPSEYDIIAENFEGVPFAESRFRRIYKGFFAQPHATHRVCVMKINRDELLLDIPFSSPSIDTYNIAKRLSVEFNDERRCPKFIDFALTLIGKVERMSYPTCPKYQDVCVVEAYLGDKLRKWCTNYGFIAKGARFLEGFAHWSWVETRGDKMVLDLQGIELQERYLLVDPVILSNTAKGGVYGPTDIGVEGMAMFFAYHDCGQVCIDLPRPYMTLDFEIDDRCKDKVVQLGVHTAYCVDTELSVEKKRKMVERFPEIAKLHLDQFDRPKEHPGKFDRPSNPEPSSHKRK